MMRYVLIVILVFLWQAVDTPAQNWPSFRGPNASGIADGLDVKTADLLVHDSPRSKDSFICKEVCSPSNSFHTITTR